MSGTREQEQEHVAGAVAHRSTRPTSTGPTLLRVVLDALTDAVVLSFALWTLLYCLGLATQWSLWPSGWLWLVATVLIIGWRLWAELGDRPGTAPTEEAPPPPMGAEREPSRASAWLPVVVVLLAVLAAAAGAVWTEASFSVAWLATVAACALALWWAWRSRWLLGTDVAGSGTDAGDAQTGHRTDERPGWASRWTGDVLALATSLGLGVLAAFLHLADTDDPYYVNRSVWVAERGNAALLDTMFSPEVLNSPYGGGIPIASIEALIGVIAHMTGMRAGAATYLVAGPVAAFLTGWALWRLVRAWAPRRQVLVLAGAVVFLALSGDSMLGNFWVPRMWQGKVMAVAMLMPLLWVYLTRIHESSGKERRWAGVMLLAGGVAFFGLTPTAVVWGPLMTGAALLAALLLRARALAVGALLLSVGPVASGLAVIAFSTDVGGKEPVALPAFESFVRILGEQGPMVALSFLALGLATLLARRGVAAALAGSSALVSTLVFAPGVLDLVNAVTGSGPILWRMLYCAPIPVLAALLLAVPVPTLPAVAHRPAALARAVPWLAVAAVLAGFVLGGRPIWSHTGHGGPVSVSSTPEWKLDRKALKDVRILEEQGVEGTVLLPPRWMKVLTMYTTDAFPVVPRKWFVTNMEEPRQVRRSRMLLFDLSAGRPPLPPAGDVRKAVQRLDLTLACAGPGPTRTRVLALYEEAGLTGTRTAGRLACRTPPAGG